MSVAKGFRLSDDSTAKLDWNYVTKPDGSKSIIEEVNDIKQDLNDIVYLSSENLVDGLSFNDGYYINPSTGNDGPVSGYSSVVGYIPVEASTTYTITHQENVLGALCNSSKQRVDGITYNVAHSTPIEITTTAETAYIRLSCKTAYKEKLGLYKVYYDVPILKDIKVPQCMTAIHQTVNPSTYASLLPNVDSIKTNSIYRMFFDLKSTSIPSGLPFTSWITNQTVLLITYSDSNGVYESGTTQLLIGRNFVFRRQYTTGWYSWEALYLEINVGSGYNVVSHFNTLTEAIVFATKYKNAIVNIYNGTFDLYTEFLAVYGNDFFTNYSSSTVVKGLQLTNKVKLNFSPFAKVVFNYTGNNTAVMTYFSPFNFLATGVGAEDGFEIYGLNLECSNCRYCVHDDPSDTSRAYWNKYINCHMDIDNSANTAWSSTKCIGGGLGRAGNINIDGCYFKTDTPQTSKAIVSYHNDTAANAGKSKVTIKNSYLYGGTIGAFYSGTSTDKTEFLIVGNSLYGNIIKQANSSSDTVDNVSVVSWNNEIRNQ